MLLRRYRHLGGTAAFYGDLRKILNPVSADTGAAGLSFDAIPPSHEPPIRRKASSLVALWLATQVAKRRGTIPWRYLIRCIPRILKRGEPKDRESALDDLYSEVRSLSLGSFAEEPALASLYEFVSELAESYSAREGSHLTLLLDRAEEIPYPCLSVVLNLLDQSHAFMAIVAARPGVLGPYHSLGSDNPIPGDHYNIQHLGASPYNKKWRHFQQEVLRAWLPSAYSQIPTSDLDLILRLSRDSIRNLLELSYNSIDERGEFDGLLLGESIKLLRRNLQSAAQGRLRGLNDDLPSLVRQIRKRLEPIFLPILLQVPRIEQRVLPSIREMSRDERFVRLALRSGYLSVPEGESWHPHAAVREIELSPLFIWEEGDSWRC